MDIFPPKKLAGGTNDAFWNGWWDEPTEGSFTDVNSGRAIAPDDYQPWYLGEPNGSDEENCGVTWVRRDAWNDEGCFQGLCGFCHLDEAPVYTLRGVHTSTVHIKSLQRVATLLCLVSPGLCRGSLLDTKYSWTRDVVDGFYTFRGYRDAVMQFSRERGLWRIALYSTDRTYATANATDYPFGRQEWTVVNDPCFGGGDRTGGGGGGGEVLVTLNLNACTDGEFNCADGQCIDMDGRCDGVLDCRDKTGQVQGGGEGRLEIKMCESILVQMRSDATSTRRTPPTSRACLPSRQVTRTPPSCISALTSWPSWRSRRWTASSRCR